MVSPQPTDPFAGMSEDQLAAMLGNETKWARADLPFGFVFNPSDGRTYKQLDDGSLVPATPAEIYMATQAEKASLGGGAGAAAPPNLQITTDERTGEALLFNPRTGGIERTGQQIGFAGVDPRETAAAKERSAAAERQLAARSQAIDLLKQSQVNLLKAADAAEGAKIDRAKLKSEDARTNATLKEQARQADLRAAVDQWQTAMNLIPALGQLSIEESKRTQDILSEGNDFLARAFESRGGASPLAKVLQADQISAVSTSLGRLRGMISEALQQSPMAQGGGFQPMAETQVAGYEGADLTKASSTGLAGGPAGVDPYNDPGAFQFSPSPAMQQPSYGGTGGGGGEAAPSGGFAGAASADLSSIFKAAPAQQTAPPPASTQIDDAANVAGWTPPTGTAAPPRDYIPNIWAVPEAQGGMSGAGLQYNPDTYPKVASGGGGGFLGSLWQSLNTPQGDVNQPSYATRGYAEGGMTRDPAMVVGDARSGKPTGHEEVIINPTQAPLAILPNEMARGFLPHYATGTIYSNPDVQQAGFGNYQTGQPLAGRVSLGAATDPRNPYLSGGWQPGQKASISGSGVLSDWDAPTQQQIDAYQRQTRTGRYSPYSQGSRGGFAMAAGPKPPTQAELVAMAQQNAPPAVRAALEGRPIAPRTALASTVDPSKYLRPLTSRQMSAMTGEEMKALGTATNVEFNAPLPYLVDQTSRQYGPSQQRRGGFVGAMGI